MEAIELRSPVQGPRWRSSVVCKSAAWARMERGKSRLGEVVLVLPAVEWRKGWSCCGLLWLFGVLKLFVRQGLLVGWCGKGV